MTCERTRHGQPAHRAQRLPLQGSQHGDLRKSGLDIWILGCVLIPTQACGLFRRQGAEAVDRKRKDDGGLPVARDLRSGRSTTDGGEGNQPKVASIRLTLRVENSNKFMRSKKRAREDIERYCLEEYEAERLRMASTC